MLADRVSGIFIPRTGHVDPLDVGASCDDAAVIRTVGFSNIPIPILVCDRIPLTHPLGTYRNE